MNPKKIVVRCNRCIMDNSSDTKITFDSDGFCSYCTKALAKKDHVYFPNETGARKLKNLIETIKKENINNEYDCLMGISGGLDSSYLTYLGHKWGLRILLVHIDDGFDTEKAIKNVERLRTSTGFDFSTIVPDPDQYNALTKAYLKAGVPNAAIPQDNIIVSHLYKLAKEKNIKYFLFGLNFSLECILQADHVYPYGDVVNIKDINRRFGETPIDKLPFKSDLDKLILRNLLGIKVVAPLDYIDYNRERAFKELADFCGYEYYGRKHLENILTAFIQLYWFPKKFGVDKRTSHLSSMIISGQLTREEALKQYLEEPIYDEEMMAGYIAYIKKQLKISDQEFDEIMSAPSHQHSDYKTDWFMPILMQLSKILKRNR